MIHHLMSKELFDVCLSLFSTAQWVGMTLCTIFCLLRTCYCSLLNNPDNLCVFSIHTNAINICSFILKKNYRIYIRYILQMKFFNIGFVPEKWLTFSNDFSVSISWRCYPSFRTFPYRNDFWRKVIPMFQCVVCIYAQLVL